jgi:hypothetical protein
MTCAFNNCQFRYVGVKNTRSGLERVKSDWKNYDNSYYRFDPEEHGTTDWTRLVLECRDAKASNEMRYPTVKCDLSTMIKTNLIITNYRL